MSGRGQAPPTLTLTAEELAGDLPMVCARTGHMAEGLSPVWFARSPRWSLVPAAVLLGLAAAQRSWAPLVTWWAAGSVLLPLLVSRAVTGRMPLSASTRAGLAGLRRRRFRLTMSALLLTWVAVGLWLLGSRAAGVLVLCTVIALYCATLVMVVAGRVLSVRGTPTEEGGVTLTNPHPDFVDAVELRRTGHRP